MRFPVVPALYTALDNARAIVTVQAVFGAASWAAAAFVASRGTSRRRQLAIVTAVSLIGLCAPVTRYDNALISESVSVSLGVLFAALLIELARVNRRATIVAVIVVGLLWGFSRQNNGQMVLAAGFALLALRLIGQRWSQGLRLAAVSFIVIGSTSIVAASADNTIRDYNIAEVMKARVIGKSYEPWFTHRGMPSNGAAIINTPERKSATRKLLADDAFRTWVQEKGVRTYAEFLVTHPGYMIMIPIKDRNASPLGGLVRGSDEQGSARRVLPSVLDSVIFPRSERQLAIVAPPIALLGGVWLWRLKSSLVATTDRVRVAGALALVALFNVFVVAHTAGAQFPRLLASSGVSLRVAVGVAFALTWAASAVASESQRETSLEAAPSPFGS